MGVYEEVEFEDMTYDAKLEIYHYPCPCGDRFEISLGDMRDGEDIARCPSCSLEILVIYDAVCHDMGATEWSYPRLTRWIERSTCGEEGGAKDEHGHCRCLNDCITKI